MSVIVRPKQLYGYRGHHYPAWRGVKIGRYVWGVYHVYSSKAGAEKGLRGLKMGLLSRKLLSRKGSAALRMVKTVRGWAVVQLSPFEQFRVKAADPRLYVAG